MKVVTMGTLKGGVGKTMLCFNLGGALSARGKRVLLIDSDLQGNLTNNMGIDRTNPDLRTTYDLFNRETPSPPPEQLILRQPNPHAPNLDLIAGSLFLHKAELRLAAASGREQILRNYLTDYASFFSQYDYILIDTNPSMSIVNQNAFFASDAILLIADVSMNALEGALLFLALWEEARYGLRFKDNVKGFIVNDYDTRNRLSQDFLEYLRTAPDTEDLQALRMETIIPRNIKITESELAATPIIQFDPYSRGSKAILALIDELFDKQIL